MAFSQFSPNIRMSGALIPANYDDDEFWEDPTLPTIPTLQCLCIQELICNSHYLRKSQLIPPMILKSLLSNAIWYGRVPCIEVLMKFYPFECLCISPPVNYMNWRIFAKLCNDDVRCLITGIKALFKTFIQPTSQLKCIDLSDIPLRDEEVNIISKIANGTLCTTNYVIYLNCIIFTEETLRNLSSTIEASKNKNSQIKIVIKQLHVAPPNYVSHNALYKLLSILDSHELQSFSYNFFSNCDGLFTSFQNTAVFHSVKVLNLAYSVRFESEQSFLSEFTYLEALDISGCNIFQSLCNVLNNLYTVKHVCCNETMPKGLLYLCMQSCHLAESSILFLAHSPLSKSLKNLNIGDNHVTTESLEVLFKACENLKMLELGDCRFSNNNLRPLFTSFSFLRKLKYLNIAFGISPVELINYAPLLAEIPSLKYLRILPLYMFDFTDTFLNEKLFVDNLHDRIVSYFDVPSRELEVLS